MKSQKQRKKKQDKTPTQKQGIKPKQTPQTKEDKDKSMKLIKSAEKNQAKQAKDNKEIKKQKDDLRVSRKQVQQGKVAGSKQEQVQIMNEVVELQIENESMAPCNSNVTLIKVLEEHKLQFPALKEFYATNFCKASKFIIHPLALYDSKAIFSVESMTPYRDLQLKLSDKFIFNWLIQILFNLQPNNVKFKQGQFYPKINKESIYITETPFLQSIILRDQNYIWDNPFRVVILDKVKNQREYYEQMVVFDEMFGKIKSYGDLSKAYEDYKYDKFREDIFSVENIGRKIKEQMNTTINNDDLGLNSEDIKWLQKQLNLGRKSKLNLFYKASQCYYEPHKFWSTLKSTQENGNPNQLLVLRIESQTGNDKLVGFYSSIMSKTPQAAQPKILAYLADDKKTSLLINISQRTTHHLSDPEFAIGYGKQILLCIGKCDIILSAFNVTNLCYFPVSYQPDNDHICTTAESLCGSKFKLKQLYVYRVGENVEGR